MKKLVFKSERLEFLFDKEFASNAKKLWIHSYFRGNQGGLDLKFKNIYHRIHEQKKEILQLMKNVSENNKKISGLLPIKFQFANYTVK